MLSTDPKKLYQEIKLACSRRDECLTTYEDQVKHLFGSAYKGDAAGVDPSAVNYAASWFAVMLPQLVHQNPKVMTRTRKSIGGNQTEIEQAAESEEAFLNVWVKQQKLNKRLRRGAIEYGFKWCFGMVTRRKHPGDPSMDTETERYLPEFVRIPITRMILDPYCEDFGDARFVGHTWYCDKDDLIKTAENADEDEGWILGEVKGLQPTNGPSIPSQYDDRSEVASEREEVHLVDIWIPEAMPEAEVGPEDGFHGTILTLGWDGNEKSYTHIRKPRPYYGPPTGPYALGGYLEVPMSPFPLGPLTITKGHEDLLRRMVSHANQSCADYRKVYFIPAGTSVEKAAKKAISSHDVVIPVAGMAADAKPLEVEIGGITDQQIRNIAFTRSELERLGGLDGPGMGEANEDTTATSDAIAAQSRQTINGHIKDRFQDFVRDILEKAAWFGFADEDVKLELTDDLEGYEGEERIFFEGGPGNLDLSAFDSFTIDIEPMSMERTNEALHQRRVLQVMQLLMQIAPAIRQMPEVDWESVLSMLGDALNMPNLNQMVDIDAAKQMMGIPVQPEQGGGEGLGVDAGAMNESAPRLETAGREMAAALTGGGIA
ncbi:MAG: hypothetical protein ACX94C_07680 [Phycisphaerales bacterium]